MIISFDEMQAKLWRQEVEAELELVAKINTDAGRCMQDLSEEGDPLTVILKRTGSQIESYGNTLRSKFKKTMVEVGEAILRYAKSHDTVIQDAQSAEAGH